MKRARPMIIANYGKATIQPFFSIWPYPTYEGLLRVFAFGQGAAASLNTRSVGRAMFSSPRSRLRLPLLFFHVVSELISFVLYYSFVSDAVRESPLNPEGPCAWIEGPRQMSIKLGLEPRM